MRFVLLKILVNEPNISWMNILLSNIDFKILFITPYFTNDDGYNEPGL